MSISKIITLILIYMLPYYAHAICLENCKKEAAHLATIDQITSTNPAARNIHTRDVKNSVFGDMNIRVGHEKIDIKTNSSSNRNSIDASIHSTIILGDMQR